MTRHFDVIIVGSGFAGALMAMISQRLGLSTALVERGRHPRFAIGESSTPLANLLLEEIADRYDLPFVRPLCKWGAWQQNLPHLACGLKRGFTFYHHQLGQSFQPDPNLERQLLVGASPNETVADTHWFRADFDQYLVQQAQQIGVAFFDQTELTSFSQKDTVLFEGSRNGVRLQFSARFLIDATGPRGFLHRTLRLPEKSFPLLPSTQALFTHFTGVKNLPASFFPEGREPPYPPEQAAVHHIFPGGWIWVLKFNNGMTSAGVAATDSVANRFNFASGERAWRALLTELPSLQDIFSSAVPIMPFAHQPRIAFQSALVADERWALLPSAAGFIDPLLSTGFPLTLLGITRLGAALKDGWNLGDYAQITSLELETTSNLIGALYANMDNFETFKQLGLLYFAAAHYSETARRSNQTQLADSFLLGRHPTFSTEFRQICEHAIRPHDPAELTRQTRRAIKPFDLVGLTDPFRGPWYECH